MVVQQNTVTRRRSLREDALNLPNGLTFMRVLLIPAVLVLMSGGTRSGNVCAVLVFALAAVTDVIDGWLARRQNITSLLGQFLDPLADKLLVLAVMVLMVQMGSVPAWPVIIIAGRELCITSLRTIAISEGLVISASRGGKDKAALQNVAVAMLILHDTYIVDFWLFSLPVHFHSVGYVLLITSIVFALTSAGNYLGMFIDAVEAKESRERDGMPTSGG